MKYILENNLMSLAIDTEGAYIDSLKYKDTPIFFSKKEIDGKVRGGSHICYPQFSSGGKTGLENHGFGRSKIWAVVDNSESHIVLSLERQPGEYQGAIAKVYYRISGRNFIFKLVITNEANKDLIFSPALHPYFKLEEKDTVLINGKELDLESHELYETMYMENIECLETNKYIIKFENINLPIFALWTDNKEKYICIEPTYNSTSFARGEGFIKLKPGETQEFGITLNVKIKK